MRANTVRPYDIAYTRLDKLEFDGRLSTNNKQHHRAYTVVLLVIYYAAPLVKVT